MELKDLVIRSREYLDHFNYDEYPGCFESFEKSLSACLEGCRLIEDCGPLSRRLLDGLEKNRMELGPRKAREAFQQDRQVFALFLTPAAKRLGDGGELFAEILVKSWNDRYPKATYLSGSYENIMRGFDANLLGLPLRKSKKNR